MVVVLRNSTIHTYYDCFDYIQRISKATGLHMPKNTTTQSASTESTFPPISRCELHRQFRILFLVDVDDNLDSIFSSDIILVVMLLKGQESVSTQVESVASTVNPSGEVQHTGVVPFLKKFESLSAAVHRMESAVGQQLSTSQSAPKSKTSSRRIIRYRRQSQGNLTIVFKSRNILREIH